MCKIYMSLPRDRKRGVIYGKVYFGNEEYYEDIPGRESA
jgi:hypothetical protein